MIKYIPAILATAVVVGIGAYVFMITRENPEPSREKLIRPIFRDGLGMPSFPSTSISSAVSRLGTMAPSTSEVID